MIKALIISYHYPPMNVIASRRAEAYSDFLHKHGIHPTVVTHRWEVLENQSNKNGKPKWKVWDRGNEVVYEDFKTYKVIRIPRYQSTLGKVVSITRGFPLLNKSLDLALWKSGHLDINDVDSYFNIRDFLWQHLKNNSYDIVIAIFTPHNHIRLGYEIKKKFKIPFVADYRDLWDNDLLHKTGVEIKASFGRKIFNNISLRFHRRWLRKSLFYTAVSQPIVNKISNLCNIPSGYCIKNGYEANIFFKLERNQTEKFIILHGGTIYSAQELSGFISGLRLFYNNLEVKERQQVSIIFLAIKNQDKQNEITEALPELYINFIKRVPREEAIQLMKDASILFYPSWTTHNGIYSGKIFEYLGVQNNILVIPSDHDVVEELINHTNSGLATDDPKVMYRYLLSNFRHWQKDNQANYKGKPEVIKQYSRESQVGKMATLIKANLPDKYM